MAKMICPSCGRTYRGLERFCSRCGVELEKDKNRCSEQRTQLCKGKEFDPDDIFCTYCGALTTFALERKEKGEIVSEPQR